jgi:hypothetical protein
MMKSAFHHTTIATQYYALYSAEVSTRLAAFFAHQELEMRTCMGDRDNYDIDGVRDVVAHWAKVCPDGNAHRVAQAVLAEREAELLPPLTLAPARCLLCSCCGAVTRGRQWHNRDTGYGLCVDCVDFCHRNTSDVDFQRSYGDRGTHYDVADVS